MADLTTDPNDPRLGRGADTIPVPQNAAYLVLSPEEIARGFVRPVHEKYTHTPCDVITRMSRPIAETYARNPWFYGSTYCANCNMHRPLREFVWPDGVSMDPGHWSDEVTQAVIARQKELDMKAFTNDPLSR